MDTSSRKYQCLRCHALVIICHRCDHGQRYCTNGCSEQARKDSTKRASKKYQATRQGRFNNAARQQRYRSQVKQKVTHHPSLKITLHDVLTKRLTTDKKTTIPPKYEKTMRCHHCGEVCSPFLRDEFLRYQFTKTNLRY
ncbi:MAG TPA: hypothetical protein EYG22_00965 [Candidatus Thioglobus sp.]|nr:hypothetical protein [Candidatus Thioglobus sp.]